MSYSIVDAKEAFPETDLTIIEELYLHEAKKDKQRLFTILMNMADPENAEALAAEVDNHAADRNEEEDQAEMIAALSGMQMGAGHGPMTQ